MRDAAMLSGIKRQGAYRYVICACAVILAFLNMGLISVAFTSYFPYMREIKRYSNTQLYLLPTIRSVVSIVCTPFSERYYRRLGLRVGCFVTLLACTLGFLIMSLAPGFWAYELAMVPLGFSYALGSIIPASLLIQQWFPGKTAQAMSVVTAGSGFSFVLLPLYIEFGIGRIGLDGTLGMEALVFTICGFLLLVLLCEAPKPGTKPIETDSIADTAALPRRQRLRLYLAYGLMGTLTLTGVSSLSMLYSTTGHSAQMTAHLISIFGAALIAGKLAYGFLCGLFGQALTCALYCAMLSVGIGLCCLTQDASYPLLVCSAVVYSLGCAVSTVGLSVIANDTSGGVGYAAMLKNLQFIYTIGGFVSGTFPGIIADRLGSYIPAYYCFFAVSCVVTLLLVPLYRRTIAVLAQGRSIG